MVYLCVQYFGIIIVIISMSGTKVITISQTWGNCNSNCNVIVNELHFQRNGK